MTKRYVQAVKSRKELGQAYKNISVSGVRYFLDERDKCVVQIDCDIERDSVEIEFYRTELIHFARAVLRELDPTPTDEILASLQRIEGQQSRE